jgi:anti-sigma regulatory factor (Ser/Thr protein kinase)/anti-anti-sigma regulatory factor
VDQRLVCHQEGDLPVAVIRLDGVLDVRSTSTLRTAVLRRLAGGPDAVVVDLAGLRVRDDIALTVFPTLAWAAARSPGAELILCAPTEPVVSYLRSLAIPRYVPVYATRAQALAHAARRRPARLYRRHLPASPSACATARRLVVHACERWDLPSLVARAELVVTELVANAVSHAGTPSTLTVSLRERHLYLSVEDRGPAAPYLRGPDAPHEPGGRGLMVVEAFSAAWGSTPTPGGKVVWATIRRPRPG